MMGCYYKDIKDVGLFSLRGRIGNDDIKDVRNRQTKEIKQEK